MEWGIRKHGGYAKAKQFKRVRKVLLNLKSMAGRVMREVERKIDDAAFQKHKGTQTLSIDEIGRRVDIVFSIIETERWRLSLVEMAFDLCRINKQRGTQRLGTSLLESFAV